MMRFTEKQPTTRVEKLHGKAAGLHHSRETNHPGGAETVMLINGKDLSGWKPRSGKIKNGWVAKEGMLVNASPGNDLVTEKLFTDFKLHAEFRYQKGSNSGVYLRGRYEVQIEDNFGDEPR